MTGRDHILKFIAILLLPIFGIKTYIDQKAKLPSEENKASDSQRQPSPPILVSSTLELPIEVREYCKANTTATKGYRVWSFIKNGLEVTGIVIAVMLALLTYKTLRETRRQANAAQDSLDSSIESFRIDERAWVEIEPIKHDTIQLPMNLVPKQLIGKVPTQMFIYKIFLKNLGKTAAYDIAMHVTNSQGPYGLGFDEFSMGQIQDKFLSGRERPPEGPNSKSFDYVPKVLGPGVDSIAPYEIGSSNPIIETFADTHKKEMFFSYLIGRIDYSDAFHVPHWAKFCFVVMGQVGDLKTCYVGNDEDRNQDTQRSRQPVTPSP